MQDGEKLEVTNRELIEFIKVAQDVLKLAEKHEKVLYGNGSIGLLRQFDDVRRTVRILTAILLALVTPLIGITISFVLGLLINRVEVVIH